MRIWALVHPDGTGGGIIGRTMTALANPFHPSQHAVDVTGTDARVGSKIDAMGRVSPEAATAPADAKRAGAAMLRREREEHFADGVWVDGHHFASDPASLGTLAILDTAGSPHTVDVDGVVVDVAASDVRAAMGKFMAECLAHEAEAVAKVNDGEQPDLTEGWPDNGEPDHAGLAVLPAPPPTEDVPALNKDQNEPAPLPTE